MLRTVALLLVSNVFMTIAWYGHLRHKQSALWLAIIVSWGIAFVEYCFQVPANRIGSNAGLSAAQLKTIQEVITLVVFVVFAWWYLDEAPRWNVIAGFAFIALGAALIFKPWAPLEVIGQGAPAAVVVQSEGSPHPYSATADLRPLPRGEGVWPDRPPTP